MRDNTESLGKRWEKGGKWMKDRIRELSISPAWLRKGHERLQDSHASALGPFSWCVRAGIQGMQYVSISDTGMKTGNTRGCRHPACSSPCSALGEKQKRVGSTETRILQKGFLPAVHVSATLPLSPSSQMCSLTRAAPLHVGRCRLGLIRAGQIRNAATALAPLVHRGRKLLCLIQTRS